MRAAGSLHYGIGRYLTSSSVFKSRKFDFRKEDAATGRPRWECYISTYF